MLTEIEKMFDMNKEEVQKLLKSSNLKQKLENEMYDDKSNN